MNRVQTACLGLISVAALSCSSVAPVRIAAGDQCFRCRRTIVNERVATETIDANGFVSKFRGAGCMAKYLVAHPDERAVIFVTDYTSGKMTAPQNASYVPVLVDRDTGESDYRAFRSQADAGATGAEMHATPLTWDAVLDQAR
jgi:hypothetical protein